MQKKKLFNFVEKRLCLYMLTYELIETVKRKRPQDCAPCYTQSY